MLLAGLTEANSFQNKRVCVSDGENSSGGLSDQEVNVLLSGAKKTLIFLMLNSVRFRISHPGSGPVDITFILRWDGKFPCTLSLLSFPGPVISCSDFRTWREGEQDTSSSWWMSGI